MIVVDASAVTLLFCDPRVEPRADRARALLSADPAWLVPEHWRTEVCSALRGLDLAGKLRDPTRSLRLLAELTVATMATSELLPRIWQLRHTLSAYDAGYVAAAEHAGLTLVTADARLARARVGECPITVIQP